MGRCRRLKEWQKTKQLLHGDMRAWDATGDAKCNQWGYAEVGADFCVPENPGAWGFLLEAEGMKEHEEEEGRLCVEGTRV